MEERRNTINRSRSKRANNEIPSWKIKEKKELEQCTFSPIINTKSRSKSTLAEGKPEKNTSTPKGKNACGGSAMYGTADRLLKWYKDKEERMYIERAKSIEKKDKENSVEKWSPNSRSKKLTMENYVTPQDKAKDWLKLREEKSSEIQKSLLSECSFHPSISKSSEMIIANKKIREERKLKQNTEKMIQMMENVASDLGGWSPPKKLYPLISDSDHGDSSSDKKDISNLSNSKIKSSRVLNNSPQIPLDPFMKKSVQKLIYGDSEKVKLLKPMISLEDQMAEFTFSPNKHPR